VVSWPDGAATRRRHVCGHFWQVFCDEVPLDFGANGSALALPRIASNSNMLDVTDGTFRDVSHSTDSSLREQAVIDRHLAALLRLMRREGRGYRRLKSEVDRAAISSWKRMKSSPRPLQ
jgi:hypothetical protein